MHHFLIILTFLALCNPAITRSQDQDAAEKKKTPPTQEEIQQAIKDLSSSEFTKREKSARLLWEAGRASRPALEEAVAKGGDLEAKLRAEQILKKFRYGIYPDTPPALAEMLTLFRDGNRQQRRAIFTQLMQKQDVDTVFDLLETLPEEERTSFTQTLFPKSADALVSPLIARGDFKRAETILAILSHRIEGARDLAAYHQYSGNIEEAIAAEEKKPEETSTFLRLSALHRAKGDLDAALEAAREIPGDTDRASATTAIEIAQGDIPTYLKFLGKGIGGMTEALGMALTIARREGDSAAFEKTTKNLIALLEDEPNQIFYVTESFLINDRTDAIIELLKPRWGDRASEILFEQRRPADVLAVLGLGDIESLSDITPKFEEKLAVLKRSDAGAPAAPGVPADEIPLEVRRERLETAAALIHIARLHVRIGYLEEADRLFTQIGEAVIASKTAPHELAFVVAEAAEARRVEAAIAIVRNAIKNWPEVGESIVPRLPFEDAGSWWGSARNIAEFDEDLLSSFERFLKFFPDSSTNPESQIGDDGEPVKIDPAKLDEAKSLIETVLKNAVENGRPFFSGIGGRAETLGFLDLAEEAFTQDAHRKRDRDADGLNPEKFAPFLALGEFYARHERWPEAVEAFRTASEIKLNRDPVTLYTLSWALKNADDKDGAADALKLARLLPLGDSSTRNELAEEMLKRGDEDNAIAEWKFIFENASPEDWEQGRAAQMLAEKAAEEKRWDDAANYLDRLMYSTLRTESAFTEIRSYLRVRYRANYFRAMAAIARKDGPAAAEATNGAFVHQPSDPTLSEEVFPALDELGEKAAVDEMFERAFALNKRTCELFPNDPQAHNSLAWLAARSNRRLDEAMIHAKRAVELDPDSAAYIDTLAETHFALGDRAKAIELSEKAVALLPDDEELQGQLKRFKGEGG